MFYWMHQHGARPADAGFPPRDWVYGALALMMQAVLPARDEIGYPHDSREVDNAWFPSRAASRAGSDRWRFPARRTVWTELRPVYSLPERHRVGHAERDEDGNVVGYMSNRLWLLERALEIKQELEGVEPLPLPLADALEQELASLFRQAAFEVEDEDWLEWRFEFPVYSGQLVTRDMEGMYTPWPAQEGSFGDAAGPVGVGQGNIEARPVQVNPRRRGLMGGMGRQPRKHYTVSQVGERNWALMPDEHGGYDVFDVSGEFRFGELLKISTSLANHDNHMS